MKFRLVSFLIYHLARALARTLRLRVVGEQHLTALQDAGRGVILVTWHGRTLIPVARFRGRGYWALISTSRDGEYQNQIFRRFGFQTVRGSTSARGAIQATLTIIKQLKAGAVLSFTPDGPRGPSHCVQPGAILMAQKSGCPIIPAGISASPRRLMRSWDRYMVPLPFARAYFVYGEPITIPADAKTEEEQRLWADRVGAAITALEEEAERQVGAAAYTSARRDRGAWRRA